MVSLSMVAILLLPNFPWRNASQSQVKNKSNTKVKLSKHENLKEKKIFEGKNALVPFYCGIKFCWGILQVINTAVVDWLTECQRSLFINNLVSFQFNPINPRYICIKWKLMRIPQQKGLRRRLSLKMEILPLFSNEKPSISSHKVKWTLRNARTTGIHTTCTWAIGNFRMAWEII